MWETSFPHLCIYSVIYLYQDGVMDTYLIFWIIIQQYFIHYSNFSIFGHWELFQFGYYVPLTQPLHFVFPCAFKICVATNSLISHFILYHSLGGDWAYKTCLMIILTQFHLLRVFHYPHLLLTIATASYLVSELSFRPSAHIQFFEQQLE